MSFRIRDDNMVLQTLYSKSIVPPPLNSVKHKQNLKESEDKEYLEHMKTDKKVNTLGNTNNTSCVENSGDEYENSISGKTQQLKVTPSVNSRNHTVNTTYDNSKTSFSIKLSNDCHCDYF